MSPLSYRSFPSSVRPRTTPAIATRSSQQEAEEDSLEAPETTNDQESFRTAAEEEDSDIGSEELEEGEAGAMDGEERAREFPLTWGEGYLLPWVDGVDSTNAGAVNQQVKRWSICYSRNDKADLIVCRSRP